MRMIKSGELTDKQAVLKGYFLPSYGDIVPKEKRRCINHKKRQPYARGLCMPCYRSIRNAIKAGTLDETKAVRDGLILPSTHG